MDALGSRHSNQIDKSVNYVVFLRNILKSDVCYATSNTVKHLNLFFVFLQKDCIVTRTLQCCWSKPKIKIRHTLK